LTTQPMEGGIKRVSFLWNNGSPFATRDHNFIVIAGNVKDTVIKTVTALDKDKALAAEDIIYNHNFLLKENATLSVRNNSGCYALIGDIKITPYLRFKGEKVMAVDLDDVTEVNLNDTIYNNTEGGTITLAIDSFKTDVTPVIENGKVTFTGITKGGKVYISATWAENLGVKTTLVMNVTLTPEVNFADPTTIINKNLVDGSFTNALNVPEGANAPTYVSSDTCVAKVDNNGVVTFRIAGTTKITANVAANDHFKAASKEYTLNIQGYTPTEESWTETFSTVAAGISGYKSYTNKAGDSAVYVWNIAYGARRTNDNVGKHQGTCINENGYIQTVNMEGGVKYLTFDWRPKNTMGAINYSVKVGNETFPYHSAKSSADSLRYERFVNAKKNVDIDMRIIDWVDADHTAYIIFGNITVVPYLLYTEKTASIKIGETYTNENLINNLEGDDKTAVQYAIVEGDEYATIEGNVVTGIKATPANKTVKVKAYLNDNLYTTYTLTVTSSSEITLDEEENNSTIIASYAGVENMTVNLTRTLAAGKFNTFCVPFDVDKEQLEEVLGEGNITRLATLDEDADATLDDSHKNLNIVIKDAESIEAGKPYLLWLENEVENPTFTDVTISTDNEGISSKDGKVTFYGITSPKTIGANEKSILFVSNNNLKWNGTGKDSDMKGLRAYFDVPDLDESSGVAARLVMRQPSAPTEVDNVNANVNANRKVIINGQLVIIRDGKMYNAVGAEL